MGLPEFKNNSLDEAGTLERGVNHHLRTVPKPNDCLFIIGKGLYPPKKQLYKYFPIVVGRSSKSLYFLLLIVYANPLRTVEGILKLGYSNNRTTTKNINILIDLGYVQQENKPRKIIPFQAYVLDKVYRITAKGVKVLSAITGY